jgi:hypothetical protein
MDKTHLSQEAKRLSTDPVFLEVLKRIRDASVEKLIVTSAADTNMIIHLQCFARICDLFPSELEAMIQSSQDKKPTKAI